jgi:PKD repeat protein
MSKQKGQGLVEFALILPLLLLMFFGIIEFGRIFQAYLTVQHAAREAARYAVTGRGGAERVRAIKETAVEATAGLNVDYSKIDRRECPSSAFYSGCVSDLDSGCESLGALWEFEKEVNALMVQVYTSKGGLCENQAGGPGERVMVRVIYNLESLTPFFSGLFPYIQLTGQMEMINEGFGPTGASHGGVLPPTLEPLPVMDATDSTTLFTDAGGLERNEYVLGDPIYVTVTDNDERFNLQSADTITVTVTDELGDSETLILTETGPNTGVFRAGLPSSGSSGSSGDGTLNTAEGNTITAEYTDDDDPSDTSSDTATMLAGPPGTDSTTSFTDSGGWDKAEYVIGAGDIYVTVRDEDENLDPGTAETVYVSVTDSETGDSVTLLPLTETGPDTGFFRNLTGLQSSIDSVNTSDNILQTEGGNTIIAEYTDDDDGTDYSYAIALVTAPVCQVAIAEPVYATDPWVRVYGSPGDTIRIWDMDAGGATIGSGTIQGSDCNAYVDISANLEHCHVLYAISTLHPLFDSTRVGVGPCGLTAGFTAAPTSGDEPLTVVFTDTSESQDGITEWSWDFGDGGTRTDTGAPAPFEYVYTASGVYTVTLTVTEADGDWDNETKVSYITVNPSTGYILLDPTCISADQAASITVTGDNWQGNQDIEISWDTTPKATVPTGDIVDGNWTWDISIEASEATTGTHTVTARTTGPDHEHSKTVEIPCPPPPDLRPDLVITDFTVSPGTTVAAYQPVSFTVVIENQGQTDALSVFWVDLFIDPTPEPPEAGQSNGDVAWEAASVLDAGETTTVILDYTFSVTGTHLAYGYVDTRMHIDEANEDNNASSPLNLTVTAGTPPTATLASEPVCSNVGASRTITVSGESWPTDEGPINLYWDGTSKGSVSPQVIWSQPITISTSEAISGTHMISASTGSTVITSTYDIPCEMLGRIDGYTWIFMGGDIVPQGRVDVFCYDGSDNLIAQTTSDDNGYYDLGYLSSGTYTVKGQAYIDEVLYIDIQAGVTVSGGSIIRVTLLLMPEY